jgi:hypothetical protein
MATKTSLDITKGGSVVDAVGTVDRPESEHNEKDDLLQPFPTEEEWATLPRVPGSIPWTAWTVAFVEFAERFSYYGTSAVCKCSAPFEGQPRPFPIVTCVLANAVMPFQSSTSSRKACRLAPTPVPAFSRSPDPVPLAWASVLPLA